MRRFFFALIALALTPLYSNVMAAITLDPTNPANLDGAGYAIESTASTATWGATFRLRSAAATRSRFPLGSFEHSRLLPTLGLIGLLGYAPALARERQE